MNTSCSQAVICITPSCFSFLTAQIVSLTQMARRAIFLGKTFWDDSDGKKNKREPCGHLTFSAGETQDLSCEIECQNDVSVDRPVKVKDINEAPEATTKMEAQTNNDNFIQTGFSLNEYRKHWHLKYCGVIPLGIQCVYISAETPLC